MSYELKLWKNVSKKINSTYQVSTQPDYTLSVELKEETSLETPTFLLDLDDWGVNYCQFQGHYYFIDDIRRNITGQMEIECTQDVLATYKTEIGDYTAFVERSAHTFDPLVVDESISTESSIGYSAHNTIDLMYSLDNPSGYLNKDGCYLLRTVSQTGANVSTTGITTYILDRSDLEVVFDFMFDSGNFADVFTDMAVKSFFNPFQYIVDLRWIPLAKTFFTPSPGQSAPVVSGPVKFGWWEVKENNQTFNTYILIAPVVTHYHTLTAPTSLYGNADFRRYNSQFTQYKCYLFGVGTIDISPVDIQYNSTEHFEGVKIAETVDFATGKMIIQLRRSDGTHPIGEFTTDFAIPVQISQVNSNLFGSAMNVVKTAGSGLQATAIARNAGAAEMAAVGGVLKTAESVISAIHAEVAAGISGNGTNGNRAALLNMPYYILYLTSYNSCDIANVVNGRPLYRNVKINTLGGYTKCAGASVNISGFAGDKEAVNAALNGGFYYE